MRRGLAVAAARVGRGGRALGAAPAAPARLPAPRGTTAPRLAGVGPVALGITVTVGVGGSAVAIAVTATAAVVPTSLIITVTLAAVGAMVAVTTGVAVRTGTAVDVLGRGEIRWVGLRRVGLRRAGVGLVRGGRIRAWLRGRCAAPRAGEGAVEVPSAREAVVHDAGRLGSRTVTYRGAPVKVVWETGHTGAVT